MSTELRATIERVKGIRFTHFAEGYIPGDGAEHGEWTGQIIAEYERLGKEFMFSKNGDGCAVFGVHAHWLVPPDCPDPIAWIRKHLRGHVAESAIFSDLRAAADAKVAARSKLLEGNVFFHTGDLGDIIAALPTIRHLGGGYLILGNRHGLGGRELMTQERFDVIESLLAVQPYITGVELLDDAPARTNGQPKSIVTHDFSRFRETAPPEDKRDGKLTCGGSGYNLATWQAKHFKIADVDLGPWLTVPDGDYRIRNEARSKAIFARTERYQNPKFDWPGIVKENSPALFVGLEDEWKSFSVQFCGQIGSEVRYRPTANFLELAQLIAASRLMVANQTSIFWIAAGLGHPLIQESDQWNLNSCVDRANSEYRV